MSLSGCNFFLCQLSNLGKIKQRSDKSLSSLCRSLTHYIAVKKTLAKGIPKMRHMHVSVLHLSVNVFFSSKPGAELIPYYFSNNYSKY